MNKKPRKRTSGGTARAGSPPKRASAEGGRAPARGASPPPPSEGRAAGNLPAALVVGIGASAGGLEALEQFFSGVPVDSGLAFVVIQHLAPRRDSLLADLLARRTSMPVVEAEHGAPALANRVYVIAPGTLLGILGGAFLTTPLDPERHGQIDSFFRSLATDQRERAVGVLLSGSGRDGTAGLQAIRDQGGLTLVQAPETARYDAMPRSAIAAGVAQQVLPVEEMPPALLIHARRLAETPPRALPAPPPPPPSGAAADADLAASLGEIFDLLHRATGHDFSQYKRGTVFRRVRRRLQLRRTPTTREYVELLRSDRQEPALLGKDLLVGVTQFFRDPEAFEYLGHHVLPQILSAARGGSGIRIWVPGCASGEEAYSIAMLLRERVADLANPPPVQIFATDIDGDAIAEARQARYAAEIVQHVSSARLARFFYQDGSSYVVVKEVREMCIFSEHSLIRDPPFLGLDLLSCRNLLIYLDVELQKKLVPLFHYALKPTGYLFLGPSETLASHADLFTPVDKRFRIFVRIEPLTRPLVEFPLVGRPAHRAPPPVLQAAAARPTEAQAASAAFERLVLQEYAPPGALVNARGEVIAVAGYTGRYLQPPAGVLTTNLFDIAHSSLRIELRTALQAAVRTGRRVVRDPVHIELNGTVQTLRLTVRPMPSVKEKGLFAVLLQERGGREEEGNGEPAPRVEGGDDRSATIEELESELRTTRASLRASIEELELTNAELKSSNEELLSTNEEMQSTNEELQSSQEELKSVNEELATVNSELTRKVDELARANNDLQNLFTSTELATMFLDQDRRITRFTPAAATLFRLIDTDVGRPISDLAARFSGVDLSSDVGDVLRTLRPIERQVLTLDGDAWFLLRVLPYRTVERVVGGAVVTLADITNVKRGEIEREHLLRELREVQRQLGADLDATTRLLRIGSQYLREGNVPAVLAEVVEAAATSTGSDLACLQLRDELSGDLVVVAQIGLSDVWTESLDEAFRGRGIVGTALDPPGRVVIEDLERDAPRGGPLQGDMLNKLGIRSLQQIPVVGRRGDPIGVLSVFSLRSGRVDERAAGRLDLLARSASDLIERGRAEEALRRSEERFRALVEASSAVLYRMSPDWTEMRQLHTRGFLAVTEASNRNWMSDYIPEDEQPRVQAEIQRAIRDKKVFELEHRVVRHDGSVGWVFSRAVPLRTERGELAEWFGGASDITARKSEELEEANRILREADRRKNEFLALLSHELRNPLTPIRNSIYVLDRSAPGGEQARQALAVIDRQVQTMTRLVEDLVDVTRITAGKVLLQRERLDLYRLVQRTVEDHREAFAEGQVELELRGAPDEAWVDGDPARLSQVVGNLLQNAVKFTPAGGRTIVAVESGTPRTAILRVSDTGRGFSPEVAPRLFEPYVQEQAAADRPRAGLGLGLAVVKGLVELLGGRVHATSQGPGTGATFTVSLPLRAPPPPPRPRRDEPRPAPRRVLVIEDDHEAAESLRQVLALDGHDVQVTHSGREGLRAARAHPPDVVFCDIEMPGLSGHEVAKAMRADPALRLATLIALTGYAGAKDVERARRAGFDHHLAKPPTIEALTRWLRRAPRGKPAGPAGRNPSSRRARRRGGED